MFINELVVISVLLLIIIARYQINSLILQPFYWNQTTFRSYQDDSLIFEVRLGDVMDLICPFYDEQQSYISNEFEQYDIYHVTKDEYDKCKIDQYDIDSITRLVIACTNPYDVMKYTLNFRSYLPIPNGLEFHSNQTYYFLSTSSTHQQCNRLKIIVHEYNRILPSSSTVSSINDQEQKSSILSHYPHHRHLFSHIIKTQRQSDPYSIKWITEGPPHENKDSNKSYRTTSSDTSILPSNILRFALSSSSSKLSTSFIAIFLLLCLR